MKFTSENFYLIGAGGYGKQLEFMLKQDKIISSAKFADDKIKFKIKNLLKTNKKIYFNIAIGNVNIRESILLVCRAIVSAISIFFLLVCVPFSAVADGLPRTFGWTAYGTTSGGYAVSVAIGNALADDGYRLRVIPGKNDIARVTPLRAGRVHFSATGIGSYLAQRG